MSYLLGNDESADRAFEESLAEARAIGDERVAAVALHRLALMSIRRGDRTRARDLAAESLALARRIPFPKLEPQALGTLGNVAWADGDREHALAILLRAAELAEDVGFAWWHAGILQNLAAFGTELGRLDDAERWAQQSLEIARSIEARHRVVEALAELAAIARRRGDLVRAGLLWGAVEADEARAPIGVIGGWERYREEFAARVVSNEDAFEAARVEGRKLTLDAAVEQALSFAT